MITMDYQRHDDRDDYQVSVSALVTRMEELQRAVDRWETRDDPEVGPYVRRSAIRIEEAARAIASVANHLVEKVQVDREAWEKQHGYPVPGDEIREWPT